ncbi:MAG: hypothetical protein NT051_00520, partial [Candidatus Micrarchaeota archaeon]|nr:hypothetical protein [Candidatus Micrarchaeota archaeon]
MAKISVLETARESYEIIRAHWKEVIVPLLVIFLISGASSFGSGFSRSFGNSYSSQNTGHSSGSALASAMADSGALIATLGVFILVIIAVVIVVALILAILQQSLWFYVFEHFHALLTKRKISEEWKPRMKRQAGKSTFYLFFLWLVDLAIFIPFVAIAFML